MSNIQTGAERMPHDLSHLGFLAGQIGRLITISTTPVIAGDSFEMDAVGALRLSPLRRGLAIDSTVDIFTFYVPHRQDRKSGSAGMPRSEERFSRNAEIDIVCRLLLEKKNCIPTSGRIQLLAISTSLFATRLIPPARSVMSRGRNWPFGCHSDPARSGASGSKHLLDGVTPEQAAGASFFFDDTATTVIYTLSLGDALPL